MLKCIRQCSTSKGKILLNRGHWHCCYCLRVYERQKEITVHLNSHSNVNVSRGATSTVNSEKNESSGTTQDATKEEQKVLRPSDTGKLVCPECSKCYPNIKALQRHVREQHKRKVEAVVGPGRYLKGVCADFEKGIFMISRTFSGTMPPIHCQHKTSTPHDAKPISSSCEVNECIDAAIVARRSGHPAFECVHLRSVQYARPFEIPVALHDDSLDEIVGGRLKWFTEKQKDMCLSQREKASDAGSPLVVRFVNDEYGTHSCRTVFLSVYDGGVHYWSRFGRVVVSFDSQTSRWSCACRSGKVSCIHKAVSKWFLYQEDNALLGSITNGSDDDIDSQDNEVDEEISDKNQNSPSLYPPSGKALTDMVIYHLENKKIPPNLPREHLDCFPSSLMPKEEECNNCKSPLSGPFKITGRAMIIGVTKVNSGNTSLWFCYISHCS